MVDVLKKALKGLWGIVLTLLMLGLFCLFGVLVLAAAGWAMAKVSGGYAWAVSPEPCGRPGPSVTALFQDIDSRSLLARRRAIDDLRCAAPADAAEFDRLAAAARGRARRRLRASALEALGLARAPALKERTLKLSADEDAGLAAAGLEAARGMGVPDSDPALAAVFSRYPQWRRPERPGGADPAAAARFEARAARIRAVLEKADLARFPELSAQARAAARAGDAKRVEALLSEPSFIAGGAQAGAALAAFPGGLPRAQALARGADPVLADVGRGWLVGLGETP